MLTIDEADRMFELGFETQVRSIANHIRPDRQESINRITSAELILQQIRFTLVNHQLKFLLSYFVNQIFGNNFEF